MMNRQPDGFSGIARCRTDKDVTLLVARALKSGRYKNQNRLFNVALRALLTPIFANREILGMQSGGKPTSKKS